MAHADWCDLILNHERCNCVGHAPLSRKQPAPPSAPLAIDNAKIVRNALALSRSVHLSGESWSRYCDEAFVNAKHALERMDAALRAAEQDAARLDWLERIVKANGEVRIGYTEAWRESGDYGSVLSEGPEEFWIGDETCGNADPTLRAAIDAAQREEGNE
jgi:hypothetical protein